MKNMPLRSFSRRSGRKSKRQEWGLSQLESWTLTLEEVAERLHQSQKPCVLEIGFGMGRDFLARVRDYPEYYFIGVDVYDAGIGSVVAALEEAPVDNVLLLLQDATQLFPHLPDDCLQAVLLYFPDPWPKKMHHKRRLICQQPVLAEIARLLKPDGQCHFRTDWQPYWQHLQEVLQGRAEILTQPLITQRQTSKYEQRGRALNHGIYELMFRPFDPFVEPR